MFVLRVGQGAPILLLLFIGVMCNAAIVPFMAVYIVEGLGKEPWFISVYSAATVVFTLIVNRQFGEWIDAGTRIAPLVLMSILSFVAANAAILAVQEYWILVVVASLCFGISSTAISTMYSFGRLYAERECLPIQRFNSYLRTMTSLGWMFAPAISFLIADQFGYIAVFQFALALGALWWGLWYRVMPKDFSAIPQYKKSVTSKHANTSLWLAAGACFCLSFAHVLCTSALPLFYIQEAKLPTFAPGLSFAIKTFVEVLGILIAPWLIARLGARGALIGSSCIALVAFYVLSTVNSVGELIVGAGLEGLYYGVFAGVGITFVQSFAEDKIARATSLYMNSLFLGALISGSSMGLIAQAYSFTTAIELASLGAIAAAVVLLLMRRKCVPVARKRMKPSKAQNGL